MANENKKTKWSSILFSDKKKGTKDNPIGEKTEYDPEVEKEAAAAEQSYKDAHNGKTNPNGPDGCKKEEPKKKKEEEGPEQ